MPLDSNLPVFFISEAADGVKHHATYYQTRGGSEPEPFYTVQNADPSQPNSRNCYASALFDAWNKEILYAEVLLHPKWSQPSLSQEDIRKNGGVPPPPEPLIPTEYTIQLYNPDQQIKFVQKSGAMLNTSVRWEFSMPQDTFRTPSGSMLDMAQDDPGATSTTPRINFAWRRESKWSKDMTCYMTGKSTDVVGKKKNKEPDIPIALFKGLKEMTVYESNLYRVEMEDPKGLEVVMLLSATVIKDVFFGNLRQVFNVSEAHRKGSRGSVSNENSGKLSPTSAAMAGSGGAAVSGLYQRPHASSLPPDNQRPEQSYNMPYRTNTDLKQRTGNNEPITDARTQWEIDAETARLRAAAEAEQREARRQEEMRRKEQEHIDVEETRRLKKMVDQEEKVRREEQKRIDKETERLRKIYGNQGSTSASGSASPPPSLPIRPTPPPQSQSAPISQQPFQSPSSHQQPQFSYGYQLPPKPMYPQPQHQTQNVPAAYNNPYQANAMPPQGSSFTGLSPTYSPNRPPTMSGANNQTTGDASNRHRRRSFLNFRGLMSEDSNKLNKKTSSVF